MKVYAWVLVKSAYYAVAFYAFHRWVGLRGDMAQTLWAVFTALEIGRAEGRGQTREVA